MPRLSTSLLALLLASAAPAQHPFRHPVDAVEIRFARSHPIVSYTLRVGGADTSGFDVEMRVRNAADTIRLAMAAHPEYDDKYWRHIEGVRAELRGGAAAAVMRLDSALWRVVAPGGEVVVRYRLRLPPAPSGQRASWRPFLSPTGGLTGGPHAFMYVVGAELAPSHITLELPPGWDVATGLTPTSDPRTFFAPSAGLLVDSPILVGVFRSWRFAVDGVPHRVVYWPLPSAAPFDTAAFVGGLERLTRQAVALFGRAPYREYVFVFQDGAFGGGLEHFNSATLGAPSADLAANPYAVLPETAHEFIHTWNLMRIRPAERGDVDYRPAPRSAGLWWSEGLTMYYADLLTRRAGLPTADSTRAAHLAGLIGRYLATPGNSAHSPERVSLATYGAPPGALGDYANASVHLQGELLGNMLDLIIRDATSRGRSMDDVMRLMLERYAGERGFTGRDVERTVAEVCGCAVRAFFDRYVRAANAIDFDRYLRLAGLRARVTWTPALGRDSQPAPDIRVFARQPAPGQRLELILTSPRTAWGRAGLHTGDRLVSINGAPVATWPEFRSVLSRLRVGDTVRVEVARPAGLWRTTVALTGYDRPVVRVEQIPEATERQRALRARWMAGAP
jgi:predicted metalloprotease with PDZ domain